MPKMAKKVLLCLQYYHYEIRSGMKSRKISDIQKPEPTTRPKMSEGKACSARLNHVLIDVLMALSYYPIVGRSITLKQWTRSSFNCHCRSGRPIVKAFPGNRFPDSLQNKESVKPAPNSKSNSLPSRLIFAHF